MEYVSNSNDIMLQGIVCLLSLGMRRAEVAALKESNIHFSFFNVKIIINESRPRMYPEGKSTKTGRERFIFGSTTHATILKEVLLESKKRYLSNGIPYNTNSWLFVDPTGKPISAFLITHTVKSIGAKLNIYITPHMLRHYFATQAQAKNINPRLIADFLGHKNISMTDHYSHQTEEGTLHVLSQVSDHF